MEEMAANAWPLTVWMGWRGRLLLKKFGNRGNCLFTI